MSHKLKKSAIVYDFDGTFRINKGIENHWDNDAINAYTPEALRPMPFRRMIFLGDGLTDIPTMKMLTYQGGHSIAVYDEQLELRDLDKIHSLISDERANFVAPANYEEKSQLDIIIKGIKSTHLIRQSVSAVEDSRPCMMKQRTSAKGENFESPESSRIRYRRS
jgi:hypothetical protein